MSKKQRILTEIIVFTLAVAYIIITLKTIGIIDIPVLWAYVIMGLCVIASLVGFITYVIGNIIRDRKDEQNENHRMEKER